MSNPYTNKPIYGKHVTELMRRINALESAGDSGIFNFSKQIGSYSPVDVFAYNNELYGVSMGKVVVTDESGMLLRQFPFVSKGQLLGNTTASNPICVFVEADEVYVGDAYGVVVYTKTGTELRRWGNYGTLDGEFGDALSIRSLGGEIYILDQGRYVSPPTSASRVQVFTKQGVFLRKWFVNPLPLYSWQTGRMEISNGCVFVSASELYISGNTRPILNSYIKIFNQNGSLLSQINISISQLNSQYKALPMGIGVSGSGNTLYVAQYGRGFCAYDLGGILLYKVDGTEIPALQWIRSICIYNDSIYSSISNQRIAVFEVESSSASTFYAYKRDAKESIGTSPDDNALCDAFNGTGAALVSKHIIDMRTAIQSLVATNQFMRSAGIPYTMATLHHDAMGDRTAYGATGGVRSTWTRTESQMTGTPLHDIDIGEIYECVRVLENAATT